MIAKAIKGKGFCGALEYGLKKEQGRISHTNMDGCGPRELVADFGEIRILGGSVFGRHQHPPILGAERGDLEVEATAVGELVEFLAGFGGFDPEISEGLELSGDDGAIRFLVEPI